MFRLQIATDNDAFAHPGGAYEIERILREVGETVRFCVTDATTETASAKLRDANGGTVGEWSLNAPETELEGALSLPPEDSGTALPMVAAWGRPPSADELEIIGRELDRASPGLSAEAKAGVIAWHLNLIAEAAKADKAERELAFRAGWNAHETGYSASADGRERALGAYHINPETFADSEEEG
jgi:hypothetical protein